MSCALKGVMAIGFDVTHNTKDRSKSYGAFVASMDLKESVKFFSACAPHKDGAEISNNIALHLGGALKAFKTEHGTLPERIFFYRDGVGDGQIDYVYNNEIKDFLSKLTAIYQTQAGGKMPKLAYIIVNKRLNTRIFANQGNRLTNPVAGTVVDNCITLPER